jgi:site-specific DNA recombinase
MSDKAIIYCRVSSKKQVTEGDGLGSQEFRCLQYAASLGFEVDKIFHEEGFTGEGDFMARPAMRKLLEYLDENSSTNYHVIFDDLKRFARDTLFHFKLKQELSIRGATPICPNFKFENTPEGTFIETLYAAFGQLERQQNQRQVVQRMKARLERGYWVFRTAPVGYMYKSDPAHGRVIAIDPPNAKIVKTALEGFAMGRFPSKRSLLEYFEKNPLVVNGKPLVVHYNLVDRLLTNVFYAGYIEYEKWNIHHLKAQHEGLISLETFDRIQERLLDRPTRMRLAIPSEFHLTQLVDCAHCGHPFTSSRTRGRYKLYFYYSCRQKACRAKLKAILKEVFEAAYLKQLEKMTPSDEVIGLIIEEMKSIFKDEKSVHDEQKSRHDRAILAKEQELKKYVSRACDATSDIVQKTYEEKIEETKLELERLKRGKSKLYTPNIAEVIELAKEFICTTSRGWENRDRLTKIDIHHLLFPRNPRYSVEQGICTTEKPLPHLVCEQIQSGELHMVDFNQSMAKQLLEVFIEWEPTLRRIFPHKKLSRNV